MCYHEAPFHDTNDTDKSMFSMKISYFSSMKEANNILPSFYMQAGRIKFRALVCFLYVAVIRVIFILVMEDMQKSVFSYFLMSET